MATALPTQCSLAPGHPRLQAPKAPSRGVQTQGQGQPQTLGQGRLEACQRRGRTWQRRRVKLQGQRRVCLWLGTASSRRELQLGDLLQMDLDLDLQLHPSMEGEGCAQYTTRAIDHSYTEVSLLATQATLNIMKEHPPLLGGDLSSTNAPELVV